MHVLNTLFLPLLAGAVLIPVIIHLIWRNKALRVDFPAMRFLLQSQKPISRWLRWKQLLLLLLRMLIFALLALLFARPFIADNKSFGVWEKHARHVILLLDVSASMSSEASQRKARSEIEQILSNLNEESTVTFVRVGNGSRIIVDELPFTNGIERIIRETMQPGYGVADLHDALRQADNKLSSGDEKRGEIYVVSDFQSSNWPDYVKDIRLQSKAKIVLVPVAEDELENAAVEEVSLPQQPGDKLKTRLTLTGHADFKKLTVDVTLMNRKAASESVANPLPNENTFVTFENINVPLNSQLAGAVNLDLHDDFTFDNHQYFVLNQNRRIRILAVNGEQMRGTGDELFYLKSALNVKSSSFEIVETNPMQLGSKGIEGFDIILLANVRGIDQQSIAQIHKLVEQGGSVVFLLGDKIDATLFNKFFQELAGCKINKTTFPTLDNSNGLHLLAATREHFLVEKATAGENISARIFQSWQLQPEAGANTIFSFDNGKPAIQELRVGKGKSLVLSFPLDAEWSDFPVNQVFLPLVHSIMHYCTPQKSSTSYYLTDDVIPIDKGFDVNANIEIAYPNGRTEDTLLKGGIFDKTQEPGIYTFSQSGKKMYVAVNVDRRESDSHFETTENFQSRLSTDGEITNNSQILRAGNFSLLEIEQQQKLWRILLILLIMFILVETIFANRVPR